MSEEWVLYQTREGAREGSMHDMTARMHEDHQLDGGCWCRPIRQRLPIRNEQSEERYLTVWTHIDKERPE
jgi:hypothetical protein